MPQHHFSRCSFCWANRFLEINKKNQTFTRQKVTFQRHHIVVILDCCQLKVHSCFGQDVDIVLGPDHESLDDDQ